MNTDDAQFFSKEILDKMKELKIDPHLSFKRLQDLNAGKFSSVKPMLAKEIPEIDGEKIINIAESEIFEFNLQKTKERLNNHNINLDLSEYGTIKEDKLKLTKQELEKLGISLAPYIAYGVLNGGSASSYVDRTKNKNTFGKLYEIYEDYFESMIGVARGKAKGITPAYINPNGCHGESFMLLKLRGLLIKVLKYMKLHNIESVENPYQVFQMDSVLNSEQISNALEEYKESLLLKDLIRETGFDITDVYTASQPLLAALTHEEPYDVFTDAHGNENSLIPMPGGHGHNFYVLKDIYNQLLEEGKRFVYLTNIDNMANLVEDSAVAYFALSGKNAAFEFSIKTNVDTKGGIALIDQNDKINCGDIGVALSHEDVKKAEDSGKTVLFNTAVGLFNLNYLVSNLDNIIDNLPMRHSIQKKDAGKYSQLEQVTWEVIGMIDQPLIFVVDKYERFIAAKTFIEGLMASGLHLDHPEYPEHFNEIANKLSSGMKKRLKHDYGMKLINNKWVPKSIKELREEL